MVSVPPLQVPRASIVQGKAAPVTSNVTESVVAGTLTPPSQLRAVDQLASAPRPVQVLAAMLLHLPHRDLSAGKPLFRQLHQVPEVLGVHLHRALPMLKKPLPRHALFPFGVDEELHGDQVPLPGVTYTVAVELAALKLM